MRVVPRSTDYIDELSVEFPKEISIQTRTIPIVPRYNETDQAVLPLPEDLRDGATVYTYDPETGARQVLRQGTNDLECRPRDEETLFTRCRHKVTGPRRDLQAKLQAEGQSAEEIQAALVAATEAGTIASAPFGTVSYRLYAEEDKIRYLWTMSVPFASRGKPLSQSPRAKQYHRPAVRLAAGSSGFAESAFWAFLIEANRIFIRLISRWRADTDSIKSGFLLFLAASNASPANPLAVS